MKYIILILIIFSTETANAEIVYLVCDKDTFFIIDNEKKTIEHSHKVIKYEMVTKTIARFQFGLLITYIDTINMAIPGIRGEDHFLDCERREPLF